MNKPFYIHVGYGRTATTWLQELVFSKNEQIHYFGKTNASYPDWLITVNYANEYSYARQKKEIIHYIHQKHNEYDDKVSLCSSEAFTNFSSLPLQLIRIKEVFPNPKIIIVLRHPISLIESFYKQNVKDGHFFLDIEEYLDWRPRPFALQIRPPIYLPDLCYDDVINYYYDHMNNDQLLILKFENFIQKPANFISEIEAFMGIEIKDVTDIVNTKIRESENLLQIQDQRWNNYQTLIKRIDKNAEADLSRSYFKTDMNISEDLKKRLMDYFKPKCSMYFND